jgi:hypothetical protein
MECVKYTAEQIVARKITAYDVLEQLADPFIWPECLVLTTVCSRHPFACRYLLPDS